MRIAIPKENDPGEKRVAATPQTVIRLRKMGFDVAVQAGAGLATDIADNAYQEAGATIVDDPKALLSSADVVLKVRPPRTGAGGSVDEVEWLAPGSTLISFVWPAQHRDLLDKLAARKVTAFGMDCVPRVTRAQKMDALSAMANIAGYRAVIEAAQFFPRFFTGQMTAAGKIDPAKVLVIGAGVAGLAASGAARSLGAIVRAFDPRSATRDQVKSMGAEYLELTVHEEAEGKGGYAKEMSEAFLKAEMALFAAQAMEVDIIITTALIPGKPAPKLITAGMVESMKAGSVIVDLAAEQGGNCAMTRPGEVVTHKGVTIVGYTDLPSRVASLSSQLYGATVAAFLEEISREGKIQIDESDFVVRGAMVTRDGRVTWPPPPPPQAAPVPPPEPGVAATAPKTEHTSHAPSAHAPAPAAVWLGVALAAGAAVGLAAIAPPSFLSHFTIFVLACFVGWQVIWNVKPALHTPLMSVTNAISGIILIGGMLQLSGPPTSLAAILGAVAVLIATINVAGGFLVTQRMLAMFRRNN
ncbi:MAG: Re/Si-specific NAD(P)(+) transhydrogenase subunit alpha [Phycisphaerales bacterium]